VNIWGEPFYRQSTRASQVFSITIAGDGTIATECMYSFLGKYTRWGVDSPLCAVRH
jgi:hypothetical protein